MRRDIQGTIQRVREIKGQTFVLKVNRGRNKIETIEGQIEAIYPRVFTVRAVGGGLNTFSYNDILSKNILFCRKK